MKMSMYCVLRYSLSFELQELEGDISLPAEEYMQKIVARSATRAIGKYWKGKMLSFYILLSLNHWKIWATLKTLS